MGAGKVLDIVKGGLGQGWGRDRTTRENDLQVRQCLGSSYVNIKKVRQIGQVMLGSDSW